MSDLFHLNPIKNNESEGSSAYKRRGLDTVEKGSNDGFGYVNSPNSPWKTMYSIYLIGTMSSAYRFSIHSRLSLRLADSQSL
jgi:hypothetical protein